jgi:glutamate 5-kinase
MKSDTLSVLKQSKRLVVKIGSVLVSDIKAGTVKQNWINALADDVQNLIAHHKKEVIIVSSGGIAMGRKALGIPTTMAPSSIPLALKQASSAVGQFHVFSAYYKAFSEKNMTVAQVLLTMSETENRRMHLNARETLSTLLERSIIPIINENDTVSTGEIRFGDNDRLAVRVAQMVDADAVILLSTTGGLFTANPDTDPKAQHIPLIETITDDHLAMAGDAVAGLSTGGMRSKVIAAQNATRAGISLIITDGRPDHALRTLFDDKTTSHSIFAAQKTSKSARQIWIQGHMKPKGRVVIDDGAVKALKDGKSLLPIGIQSIEGGFERGDTITVHDTKMHQIAVGLSAFGHEDAQKIIRKNSREVEVILGYPGRTEMIHRDNLVLLS